MHEITLENYRCFRQQQTARIAPVTLLVGENGTGKTSFMAMIQVLLDIAYYNSKPDFKKFPYDLGSFYEIAHHRGGGGRAETFKASFSIPDIQAENCREYSKKDAIRFLVEFGRGTFGRGTSTAPIPIYRRLSYMDTYIEVRLIKSNSEFRARFGTSKGSWQAILNSQLMATFDDDPDSVPRFNDMLALIVFWANRRSDLKLIEILKGDEQPINSDWKKLFWLANFFGIHPDMEALPYFASAPVRSKPSRIYGLGRQDRDLESDYIPMYLADVYFRSKNDWKTLRKNLERFGRDLGLFDEIAIKPLGRKESAPFQLQVRKFGTTAKGPKRNLIDVGVGVSQVLPIITELSRKLPSSMNLIHQPEAHLHPRAQAALGSCFCRMARADRQLVVETHSDHLLDRVRMDVRDRKSNLKPEDVSILFFERKNLGVQIHSLRIDERGQILNAPKGYRKFFMDETRRSIGL